MIFQIYLQSTYLGNLLTKHVSKLKWQHTKRKKIKMLTRIKSCSTKDKS